MKAQPINFEEWLNMEPEAAADRLAEYRGYNKEMRDFVASLLKDPERKKQMVKFVEGCRAVDNQEN